MPPSEERALQKMKENPVGVEWVETSVRVHSISDGQIRLSDLESEARLRWFGYVQRWDNGYIEPQRRQRRFLVVLKENMLSVTEPHATG